MTFQVPGQGKQGLQFLCHSSVIQTGAVPPGDHGQVNTVRKLLVVQPKKFPDKTLDPVPDCCMTYFLRHGNTEPGRSAFPIENLHQKMGRTQTITPPLNGEVIAAFLYSSGCRKGKPPYFRHNRPLQCCLLLDRCRNCQAPAATGPTTLDDRTTILGLHSFTETMGPLPADPTRLIGAFHLLSFSFYD